MLLVIPVSEADAQMAEPVSAIIAAFGPYPLHDLLVTGSHENAATINKLAADLGPHFRSVDVNIFACPIKGWPKGPNYYFRSTVTYLFSRGMAKQPWYYFELDNTPLKAGWLDTLQTEYNLNNAVFMGAKQPTVYNDAANGNQLVVQGHHMCGTSIYPANFVEYSSLWRFEEGIAWDVWIQWEVLPHLHESRAMQHNWKTINYRRKNGKIVSDNFDMPHPDLHTNDPVREEAVVCHGCKDGSLSRLILTELGLANETQEPVAEAAEPEESVLVFPKKRNRRKALEAAA